MQETLSKEELAYLIKIVWEALQAPSWSRDDLIEFGKAIFGKTPLKELDPKKFNQLFPFLKSIAEHLGIKLKETILPAPPPAADQPDAPTAAPHHEDEKCKASKPPATAPTSDTPHQE